MRPQYIWNNDQHSRIMAILFDDLNRFLICVRDKLYETFTVYTVVAFTRLPRVAVKSVVIKDFFSVFSHDSKRGMRVTVACSNRTRSSMVWKLLMWALTCALLNGLMCQVEYCFSIAGYWRYSAWFYYTSERCRQWFGACFRSTAVKRYGK